MGLAAAVDSSFCPAVIERYGAVCEALLGFLRGLCGDGERCAWQCEDHTFSQSSRQTYALGLLGFAAVVSDAALLDRVVSMDTQDVPEGRYVVPAVAKAAQTPSVRRRRPRLRQRPDRAGFHQLV